MVVLRAFHCVNNIIAMTSLFDFPIAFSFVKPLIETS